MEPPGDYVDAGAPYYCVKRTWPEAIESSVSMCRAWALECRLDLFFTIVKGVG